MRSRKGWEQKIKETTEDAAYDTKGRLATILLALTFFGCKGTQQTSASGNEAGGGVATSFFGGGTQTENVIDPGLNNMVAYSVTIPAKWHFQECFWKGLGWIDACSFRSAYGEQRVQMG